MSISPSHLTAAPASREGLDSVAARLRLAARTTLAATGMLGLGAIAISVYFGSGEVGNIFGPISDVLFAAFMLLMIPAVLAVRSLARGAGGAGLAAVSAAAIGGMVVAATGHLLLVAGAIDLQTSFATFGIGLAGFMAWGVALAVLAFRHGVLPRAVGAWPLAAAVLTVVATVTWFALPQPIGYIAALLLGVAVFGWLISLGRAFRAMA